MEENLERLIRIQDHIIQCRKLAAELPDPEISELLRILADQIERQAREIDGIC